jgi:hypothetical protein
MIINHTYKFIFLKTSKTAGTSIEIALSKFCSPTDVVTPIYVDDEKVRSELGYQGPANYLIPFGRYTRAELAQAAVRRQRLRFRNHSPARYVRQYIDPEIWTSYFKFTVERNPWDKVVSKYYWDSLGKPDLPISDWVAQGHGSRINGYDIYSIDGEVCADRILRYENLSTELQQVTEALGLPEALQLPRAKGNYRADRRHYREILGDAERRKVAIVYAREIALMEYEF